MSAFTGRKLDLLVTSAPSGARGAVSIGFPSAVTAGPQKAAQRFLLMFLTRRGTVKADPTFGTTFLATVQSAGGSDQSTARARSAFNTAVQQVIDWDKANTLLIEDLKDDERVTRVELQSIAVLDDNLALVIRLELASRDPVTYITSSLTVPRT